MNQPTDEQVLRAARKMCQLSSEACNVNFADNWFLYGSTFVDDARQVLDVVFAEEKS